MKNEILFSEMILLKEDLKLYWGDALKSIVLIGSRVKGNNEPESDLDVIIISDNFPVLKPARFKFLLPYLKKYAELMRYASFILLPTERSYSIKPFYLGALDGFKIIYDREDFFSKIIKKIQHRLKELGSYKQTDPMGNEYWVLIPDDKYKTSMRVVI
ncbi:MAG: nucleotidyltransferase domain-containing protein [Candidatus Hydrogenedentota bacterium]